MGKIAYLRSIFSIIEKIIKMEMRDQGRGVVENYLNNAAADSYAEKARYAIAVDDFGERRRAGRDNADEAGIESGGVS